MIQVNVEAALAGTASAQQQALILINMPDAAIPDIGEQSSTLESPQQFAHKENQMALLPTTWNPLRQLTRFDPLSDFEDAFRGLGRQSLSRQYQDMMELRMDITEDDKSYFVNVDIPGVDKDKIDVAVQGNTVTINAEVEREKSRESKKEVYSERFVGKAYRSFSLPTDVDSTKSEASYDGGVLKLKLQKLTTDTSRHLSIN